ncbi:MAG: metallophosphoesterase [Verrucomicrobiales bacterium]
MTNPHLYPLVLATLLATLSPAPAKTARHRLVWREDPSSRATIGWEQVSGANAIVHYGPEDFGQQAERYPHHAAVDRSEDYMEMNNAFVFLEDLPADSPCYFVIEDDEGVSERLWFRTAPGQPKPFTFIAGGDTKSDDKSRARGRLTNRMVPRLRPLFILYVGDFTSGRKLDPQEWKNWLADWREDTVSADGRIFPLVPVRGNHETVPDILYNLFALEAPENYFAFDIGGDLMRLYVLNSQIHVVPGKADGGGNSNSVDHPLAKIQTDWLRADLEAHPDARFKVASYHKPFRPHTKGKKDNDYLYDAWAQMFYANGMTLTVEGDSHMHKITYPLRPSKGPGSDQGFVRDDDKGTVFTGEGSWGAAVRPNDDDKPWTLTSASVTQFKWIHVDPEMMELHTVLTENVDEVEALSEDDLLAIPAGLERVEVPGIGLSVKIPFALNGVGE